MKRFLLAAAAIASVSATALPASAAPWLTINQRQRNIDARIDQGVRTGALTRAEALRLRAEFRSIANLEGYYRRTGGVFTQWERNDLDRRLDVLKAKVKIQKNDYQTRR
ncbi:MAG: hypothetical protein ACXW3D_02495 [Caulobacteraceae bacterium]